MYDLVTLGKNARRAARRMRAAGAAERNAALFAAVRALRAGKNELLEANRTDLEIARRAGTRQEVLERISLTGARIDALCTRTEAVIAAEDPIGSFSGGRILPNLLGASTVRVPIGVVAFVADGAAGAAADAFALCLKSGNVCVLAGGQRTYGTDRVLVRLLRQAVGEAGLPLDALQFVEDVSEETTRRLLTLTEYIDLVLPHGETEFVRRVLRESSVPAFDTAGGACCLYIDRAADPSLAVRVTENACTAASESTLVTDRVLVHAAVAEALLPRLREALDFRAVPLCGGPKAQKLLPGLSPLQGEPREGEVALVVVDSLEEALEEIEQHSAGLCDTILTADCSAAMRFSALVNSAAVAVNASPHFAEGGQEEPGVSLGFSAGRLHVRGPIGLRALTTGKNIVFGSGQIR